MGSLDECLEFNGYKEFPDFSGFPGRCIVGWVGGHPRVFSVCLRLPESWFTGQLNCLRICGFYGVSGMYRSLGEEVGWWEDAWGFDEFRFSQVYVLLVDGGCAEFMVHLVYIVAARGGYRCSGDSLGRGFLYFSFDVVVCLVVP